MVDINLRVNGNSSSGVASMEDMSEAIGKSSEKWHLLADATIEAAKEVVKFAAESVKAYAEHERIQRQLTRAAGEYSTALEEQAQALSRLYAVDDDVIMKGQILLTQWGGAGAASEEVTKATLNLAAAMGTDLNGATETLIRNVESGGVGLAKMGIHFKATGDKGHDLAAAVEAINAKLGGAAAADANSLTGQLHAASIAFEDVKKSIGESISVFLTQTGIVGRLTEAMRGLQTALGVGSVAEQNAKNEAYTQLQEHLNANLQQRAQLLKGIAEIEARGEEAPKSKAMVKHLDENIAKLKEIIRLENQATAAGDPAAPAVTGLTNKGLKEAVKGKTQAELDDISLENAKKFQRGMDTIESEAADKETANYAEELSMSASRVHLAIKEGDDKTAALQLSIAKDNELYDKQVKHRDEQAAKMLKETNEANAHALEEDAKRWSSAGDAIGASFVNALSDQLQKMSQGGEFDVAIFVGDILASAVAVAGNVIGAAYGQPELGAALGNLAAMGVRAGASAISAGNKKKAGKMHDGGWVGAPRHHDGTWIGDDERRAILQTGERVLSRQEVHHMGGPGTVDNMARGRGGPTVVNHIQAIDSKNAAESFMADLGQGMKRALRTGQGDVPRLLGKSPR